MSSVIRLRTPLKKVKFHDLIRGDIEIDSDTIGEDVYKRQLLDRAGFLVWVSV